MPSEIRDEDFFVTASGHFLRRIVEIDVTELELFEDSAHLGNII
jgi:hypothetical protein